MSFSIPTDYMNLQSLKRAYTYKNLSAYVAII